MLAAGVGIAPALGGFAGAAGLQRHQGQFSAQALDQFGRGQHFVHAPAVGGAYVHVFNEAQRGARAAKVARHGQNFVVVGAALDHHVHLDVRQPCGVRGLDARQHVGHRKVHIVHAAKHRIVQSVQAHGHAVQPGFFERARLARQQRAVGGEGEVRRLAIHRAQLCQLGNQLFDVLAQQGLAASEANLAHPVRQEQRGQPGDFFKAQQRAVRQVRVVLVEHFLGHAVVAAEVAAVGHADAQITQGAPPGVHQQASCWRRVQRYLGHQVGVALVHQGNDTFSHGRDCAPRPSLGGVPALDCLDPHQGIGGWRRADLRCCALALH